MGLGLITAACCIVRTVLNWQTVHSDQTWVGIDNFMWRCVEVNLGIGCACIPTLLPLYRLLRDKIGSLSTKQGSKSSIFSRLRRGWGPRTDAASDRRNLAPFSDEKRKSMERKGFVRHQDSDQNINSNQRQAAAGVGRGILVETDLRVEGQTMEMQRLRDARQMQSKQNTDGSGEVWDGVSRLEVEDRV